MLMLIDIVFRFMRVGAYRIMCVFNVVGLMVALKRDPR